jgi:hypothetical protein
MDGMRIELLVVPPDCPHEAAERAHRELDTLAQQDGIDRTAAADRLLASLHDGPFGAD